MFRWCLSQGADVLLTVKSNQKTLHRQIGCQFQGKRHIPCVASDRDKRHGRDTVWNLRAKEAPEPIKANWPGSAWIVEVITGTLTSKGNRSVRRHLFLTSVRTTPQALLRLIRQRWSIENEWHWARDAQLDEDAHRYANRIGAPVFAFLRTIVMETQSAGGHTCSGAVATAPSGRGFGSWPTTSKGCLPLAA